MSALVNINLLIKNEEITVYSASVLALAGSRFSEQADIDTSNAPSCAVP